MAKKVYTFGDGKAEGNASMRNLLGGKGANLAEMNLLGMPVPPGFTITTEVCTEYTQYGRDKVVEDIKAEVEQAIAHVEKLTGNKFDDPCATCISSFRSPRFHAGYDGYRAQPRYERRNCSDNG